MSTAELKTEEEQEHDGGETEITSGGVDLVEHKDVNMESTEMEEARAKAAKKIAYNRKKKEKKRRTIEN